MSIATPEGVELDLVLAGLGSRVAAGLIDLLLKGVVIVAASIANGITGTVNAAIVTMWVLVVFLILFGYDVLFEVFAGGRTPGKRWTGLRVVNVGGDAVGVGASVVRNLLRLIDSIPGAYLVGMVAVTWTRRHQRIGDLVAGTLVVRERRDLHAAPPVDSWVEERVGLDFEAWDVSAITAQEVGTVRQFLERRAGLTPEARRRIAVELATRLRPKVAAPDRVVAPETFLEDLVAAKARRARA